MTPLLQTAGWGLVHFVWQGVAIAAAASMLLRLTRHRSANTRYVIACVAPRRDADRARGRPCD